MVPVWPRVGYFLVVLGLLAVATLLAHGWALGDGLFLDDHLHYQRLGEMDWSWSTLTELTTIEPQWFAPLWWQDQPVRWIYFRPLAVALKKTVYDLTGGSIVAQHAVSLGLHLLTAYLVFVLCWRLTQHRFWSIVGGLLFVIYSHSVFAVGWLAAQNTVLQTALTVAALLAYLRASRLEVGPAVTAIQRVDRDFAPVPGVHRGWLAATFGLWLAALASRENAIVLPVILIGADLAFGGRAYLRARWRIYWLCWP